MDKLIFWAFVIGIFIYGFHSHWFDGIGNFFNMIKSDIEYQRSLVPTAPKEIETNGIIEVEQTNQVKRRSGLGTVHSNR